MLNYFLLRCSSSHLVSSCWPILTLDWPTQYFIVNQYAVEWYITQLIDTSFAYWQNFKLLGLPLGTNILDCFCFLFFWGFFCCYCCCCCCFFDSLILITTLPKFQTIRVILELNLRSDIFLYTFSLCFKPIFSAGSKIYLYIFTIFFMFVCFLNLLSTCSLFVFN